MWFRNIFNAKERAEAGAPAGRSGAARAPGYAGLPDLTISQLNRLALDSGPLRLRLPLGERSSAQRRPASEFREHRAYAPGDDFRYVDWKASARHEHIFIKQGESHKAARVVVALDCSASMAWGQPPKSLAALALAHALGYLALANNDRLEILPFSGSGASPSLGPFSGKGQAARLRSLLGGLRFEGTAALPEALAGLGRPGQGGQGGLVLVISDLLGGEGTGLTDLGPALQALPAPEWGVVICHLLHPAEREPELNGYVEMHDIENQGKKAYRITPQALQTYRQHIQRWREQLAQSCAAQRALYLWLSSGDSLEKDILPQLIRARVVRRV